MKRSLITAAAALLLAGSLFAGGIVTNTNHSAMYVRMGNRTATLGIDAVYYNPAGLTKLGNGFHFSINNQIIGQTRTVTTDYDPVLTLRDPSNDGEFLGEVSAPLFPGIYGVFKIGKWAFSAGFNPVGGGGGATYDAGLPSLEYSVADIPAALIQQGQSVSAYRLDALFEGTSVFFGYQANVSYAINDMISVALGARYVTAKETYTGHMKDVAINAGGTWTAVPTYFNGVVAYATGVANDANTAATALQAAIDMGAGDMALTDATLIAALTSAGLYVAGMTNAQAQTAFQGIAATATASAAAAQAQADATSVLLADQDLDAEKTASGITPIVSVNIQPIDMLNVAIRYEHKTTLEFTTSAETGKGGLIALDPLGNPVYMFQDGAKAHLDMPAFLDVGASLRPIGSLLIAGHYGVFMEKNADWDGREEDLDGNSWELGLGAEYSLSDKFLVSAGYGLTHSGASPDYQTDQSYSLGTSGISAGFAWDILPMLQLNVGGQYVIYQEGDRSFQHDFAMSGTMLPIAENLQKTAWVVGVGLNISIAGKGE